MKFSTKALFVAILSLSISVSVFADPPEPKEGERWVRNDQYSDEFNGNQLNTSKWRNSFNGWKGRQPAYFDPAAVSVSGGNMIIRNHPGVPPEAPNGYTMSGGAVQSVQEGSHFGYYECNFRASRVNMSTTFWLSSSKTDLVQTADPDDTYSQELDICESIGGAGNFSSDFRKKMKFNTHYRVRECPWPCPEIFYSKGNNQVEIRDGDLVGGDASLGDTESWEAYHTYACHWRSAQDAAFFVDDRFIGVVTFRTDIVPDPFNDPMRINMVTETYNWATPHPTDAQLSNDNINASYYNWVRTYVNLPVDQPSAIDDEGAAIYTEETRFTDDYEPVRGIGSSYEFVLVYKANVDRDMVIVIKDQNGNTIKSTTNSALAGYGKKRYTVTLDSPLTEGNYTVTAELRNGATVVDSEVKGLTVQDGILGPNEDPTVSFTNLTDGQQFFEGADLGIIADAADADGEVISVKLYMDGVLVREEFQPPYNWGTDNVNQTDALLLNLAEGDYTLRVVAEDNRGGTAEEVVHISVIPEGQVTLSTVNDAYLQGGAGNNFNNQDLRIEHNNRTTYLMFDLSTLPGGAVTSAKLQMTVGNDAGNGTINVYQVGNNWQEETINGGNKPTLLNGTLLGSFSGIFALNNQYLVDLTGVDFTSGQVSLVLEMEAGGNDVSFSSKEAGANVAPKLITVVETITGEHDVFEKEEVVLYPNPTKDEVHISKLAAWTLFNLSGQPLVSQVGTVVSLDAYPRGVYWVAIGTNRYKVVKQ